MFALPRLSQQSKTGRAATLQKFQVIEGLRGWLAWWVVLGHALMISSQSLPLPYRAKLLLGNADWAVSIFIIISGFVITHLLLTRQEPYGRYLARRFFRIWPLLLVTIIVAAVFQQFYVRAWIDNPFVVGGQMRSIRLGEEALHPFLHRLLHLTMLHGAVPDSALPFASSTYLSPAWSLSLEWQFYIVAPIIVAALQARRSVQVFVVVLLTIASAMALQGVFGRWLYPSMLLLGLPFFMIGIGSRLAIAGMAAAGGMMVAVGLGLFGALVAHSVGEFALVAGVWAAFLLFALVEQLPPNGGVKFVKMLGWIAGGNPVIRWLGKVSYSTYLAHIPVLSLVVGTVFLIDPAASETVIARAALLGVVLTVPASYLLFEYVEQPGNALGRWVTAKFAVRRMECERAVG